MLAICATRRSLITYRALGCVSCSCGACWCSSTLQRAVRPFRVLHDCTGLTGLHLQGCVVHDAHAATAAIASLTELQSLTLEGWAAPKFCTPLLAQLEQLSNLTHLSLTCGVWSSEKTELVQLSRLVNLQHLKLTMEICGECPCNVLAQLGKLTCLDVSRPSEDLQQLSTLTALQQLCLKDMRVASGGLLLQQLLQLTSLKMTACNVGHGTGSIFRCLQPTSPGPTALQSLALCDCAVEPGALACATQLRALSLKNERDPQGTEFENLLVAIGELSLLTTLSITSGVGVPGPPPEGFTALTASTNLCALKLGLWSLVSGFEEPGEPLLLQDMALFRPGTVYPHLRLVDLQLEHYARVIPLSEQQLQLLCSCCPALRRLTRWSCPTPSPPTALLPLGK